jgi:hypothetical protein
MLHVSSDPNYVTYYFCSILWDIYYFMYAYSQWIFFSGDSI